MSGLKKLLKRKDNKAKNVPSTEDLSQSGREMAASPGVYLVAKEKDLPKLHKAVWTRDMTKLKQLIKKADINQLDKENRTALHLAASMGNEEMCRFLLANKAKTNLCDNYGRTPLMKAAEVQSHSCTEVLLENGADANVIDVMSSTPLHLASANGEIDIAVQLIGKAAKVNAQDKEGFTPLHVASSLGYQDFVGFLIHEGASIDAVDAHGRTSLMTAAGEGHIGIVKLLLQNNANTEIKDTQGWKASDHAIIQGHHSCSNIIEEHEERQEAQQRQAPASKAGRKGNNNNLSGLLGTDELEFSFGGPAIDKGGESASGREDDSASHDSVGETSWNSSGGEDALEAVNKKHGKPSLLAALKPVTRSESDVSLQSHKSASRIPVRKESLKSDASQASKATPDKPVSRIPVLATTGSPVLSKKPIQEGKSSTHSTPTNSVPSTPANVGQTPAKVAQTPPKTTPTLGTPNMERETTGGLRIAGDVSPSRLSVDGQQSLPWESIQVPSDDESEITDSDASEKVAALLEGRGPTKESKQAKGGIFMTEPDDKESDMNLTISDDDDEGSSSESLPIDDDGDDTPIAAKNTVSKPPTSAAKVHTASKEEDKKEEKVPKLDLGSSVSSVSDPDLSDASVKKNVKTKQAKEDSMSEDSEWDTSDDDILPSDDPGTTAGSSLFGSSKRTTPVPPSPLGAKTQTKKTPKEDKVESDSEATETESEWEQERRKKKQSKDVEKAKDEERIKKWEEEQAARDEALALEVQKELEMELEMERLERESEEERRRVELRQEEEQRRIEEREDKERQEREERERKDEELRLLREEQGRRQKLEEEKFQRERDERLRVEEALRTLEREKEEERLRIEQEKEEELERLMRLKEEEMVRLKTERDEERQRREEEEQRLKIHNENELRRIQLEREEELERQMQEKEQLMEVQKRTYEEKLHLERKLLEEREAAEARKRKEESLRQEELERQKQEELLEKQRKIQEEEDKLLEAYRMKQEELLEQEHRFEEEMARRERELEERMKVKELERRPVVEEPVFVVQERQVSAEIGDLGALVKTHEDNVTQRKEDLENSIRKREEEVQQQSEALKDFQKSQEQLQSRHDKLKTKNLQGLSSMEEEEELQKVAESIRWKKAEKEMLEEQQMAHHDITEQHALEVKIEMEKRQLQDLESRKEILDRQVGAKLTELANRQRREELEEKSRQLMQEREQLNASFEAVKRRSVMLESSAENVSSHDDGDDKDAVAKMRKGFTGQEKVPVSPQPLSNGYVEDVDWSESSEENQQPYSPVMQAQMLSSGLPRFQSTTKVDRPVESPITQSISPITKTTPLSSSAFVYSSQDAQSVNKLQESLRDSRRQIDKLKERNAALETSRKHLEKDMADVQGKLQVSSKDKADVEHSRLQTESDFRSLRYKYEQESEARRVAESLLTQLKDQIRRSDDKLAKEMEMRQKLETEIRHLQKSNKDFQQTVSQQEVDLNDLQKSLSEEQETRVRMTDMYNDVKKQLSVLMQEARTTTHEKAVVMAELEAVDMTRKTHEANSGSLRDHLMSAQTELAEKKARLEATVASTNKELDMLREKLLKKSDKLAKAEDVISELRASTESLHTNSSKEHTHLRNKIENESLEKKQMESEIASLKIRLENANNELDKASAGRSHAENQSHGLRDELYQAKLKLEKENASLRETNQHLNSKLDLAENKASSLDQELQLSTLTMTEKGGHLNLAQREVEHMKASLQRTEEKLAMEKEQNAKLSSKLETTESKLLSMMSEGDSLKRQLEIAHDKIRKLEETAVLSEAKYNSTIDALRADLQKNKELMADNKNSLAESIQLLKNDSNKISEKNIRQEEEIKQLNQELNTTSRRLAQTETALELQTKAREELENDRSRLREQLRVFETKLLTTEDVKEEMSGRANRLEEKLGQSMRASDDTASRLASRSADLESVTRSLTQLESLVNRLKVDKSQLATALKDEQIKGELLLKEIRDVNEARQSLEALLTNLKAENIQLEDKIQNEELSRTISGKEATEAKGLWESELRARTKLGTKIFSTEKKLAEAQTALNEERRKTRKVIEMKKAVEAKLEAQDDRSDHHHKDIIALKTQLKAYKRRLKEYETSEGRIPSIRNEFDKERAANESHISSLRRQIDNLSDKLRQEMEARTRLELTSKQQQQELSSAKANEKEIAYERDRLDRANRQLEEEIQRTTAYYEEHYVEKGQLDVFKKELETKSRFEINRKLEEINHHLAEESSAREKLDRMREQNVAKTRTEMDQMIADLKNDLSRSRSNVHEHETQKDTLTAETKRYKELYENEINTKNKLTNRLAKANEKVAESKAMLNLERSRRIQSNDRDSGFVTSPKYSPDPLGSFINRSPRSPNRTYTGQDDDQLMKAVENELNKSIKRHLETSPVTTDLDLRPSPLTISDAETGSYPPLTHASKEYMSLLQKKYFV